MPCVGRCRFLSTLSRIARENAQTKKFLMSLSTAAAIGGAFAWSRDVDCPLYDIALAFLIKFVDPEKCHRLSIYLACKGWFPVDLDPNPPSLAAQIGPLKLVNPIGIAAGFDKDAEAPLEILKLGFGFIEVGTVVLRPQPGNSKPRVWRIPSHLSLLNYYGFNSKGIDVVVENLKKARLKQLSDDLVKNSLIGVSLGRNRDSTTFADDLSVCLKKIAAYADYIAINVSSPNTKNLRNSQSGEKLKKLICSAKGVLDGLKADGISNSSGRKPLLCIKVAPDLSDEQVREIAAVALECNVDALIVCNTTISRPEALGVAKVFPGRLTINQLPGGLSGAALREISTKLVYKFYKYTGGRIPIIASGGVFTGRDVLEKVEAGACACQVFTGLIYRGPSAASRIKRELIQLLSSRGYTSVGDAVGRAHGFATTDPK